MTVSGPVTLANVGAPARGGPAAPRRGRAHRRPGRSHRARFGAARARARLAARCARGEARARVRQPARGPADPLAPLRRRKPSSRKSLNAIEVRGVEKRYGALQALSGVSLAIGEGEFFGLLGPNGAGKTTLINVIAGLARADAGVGHGDGRRRGVGLPSRAAHARRGAAGAGVRPVLHGARDPAHPVGLLRHPRQRRVDRRGDAAPRPLGQGATPTCARFPAA